ncbi:MAG: hypothetical protein ACLFPE_05375 [Bacteroidales bacterium]
MVYINLAVEDSLSEIVLTRIINLFPGKYNIQHCYGEQGYGYLKSSIRGFNQASKITPFLVLTDLDRYECPLALIKDWIAFPLHANLIFRIAVREVESWLLADSPGFAKFLNISESHIPSSSEEIINPKEFLINLARKSGRRKIKEDLIPSSKFASIGPNYNGRLTEFVLQYWNVHKAIRNNDSLEKTYDKLKRFTYNY